MKSCSLLLLITLLVGSCDSYVEQDHSGEQKTPKADSIEKSDFFPVTEYLYGQITEIKSSGINPVKIEGKDSTWLKIEELEKEFAEFLEPRIDSMHFSALFRESKFLDQTIDAYTFSYDPRGNLPDSVSIKRWDVYVDPATNKVKRIFMVKGIQNNALQLTWQSGRGCKLRYFKDTPSEGMILEKEIEIIWRF